MAHVSGNLAAFIERLDDEYIKSLQNIDPHTKEYISRLQDEQSFMLVRLPPLPSTTRYFPEFSDLFDFFLFFPEFVIEYLFRSARLSKNTTRRITNSPVPPVSPKEDSSTSTTVSVPPSSKASSFPISQTRLSPTLQKAKKNQRRQWSLSQIQITLLKTEIFW